mmetsp:Transcript_12396/g.31363  ORF Transcript_12396/g.31363 Transcript_12396/m.31363 type:complete len:245 (-) Transcript_12396:45-779(-)
MAQRLGRAQSRCESCAKRGCTPGSPPRWRQKVFRHSGGGGSSAADFGGRLPLPRARSNSSSSTACDFRGPCNLFPAPALPACPPPPAGRLRATDALPPVGVALACVGAAGIENAGRRDGSADSPARAAPSAPGDPSPASSAAAGATLLSVSALPSGRKEGWRKRLRGGCESSPSPSDSCKALGVVLATERGCLPPPVPSLASAPPSAFDRCAGRLAERRAPVSASAGISASAPASTSASACASA